MREQCAQEATDLRERGDPFYFLLHDGLRDIIYYYYFFGFYIFF